MGKTLWFVASALLCDPLQGLKFAQITDFFWVRGLRQQIVVGAIEGLSAGSRVSAVAPGTGADGTTI